MSKKQSRLDQELLEMAEAQHRLGLLDTTSFHKITIRHLGTHTPITAEPITAEQIRAAREREHLSQAAFARYLNVTTGFVSQLERGTKEAKGPVRALLNVIRHHGLMAVLGDIHSLSPNAHGGASSIPCA